VKMNRSLLIVAVLIAATLSAAWTVYGRVSSAQTRAVFYKVVHRSEVNRASTELYTKELSKLGGGGWELVLIDGDLYVFKQVK
jgi:hypothetical protein